MGEMALAVQPRLTGRVDAGEQRRMNAFAGRALTAPLLHAEQNHRSRRIALLNRALSAGVVEGLGLAFFEADIAAIDTAIAAPPAELDLAAPRRLTLDSGMALSAMGEEVVVPQPLDFDALDLPLWAPDWLLRGDAAPARSGPVDGTVLDSRRIGGSLRTELLAGRAVPRVGIVVLEPVEHWQVDGADPFDQCERDLEAEAFEDQQRRDAGRLLYFAWPEEWLALRAPDAAWRNRLAYQLFGREAELGSAQAMPWHGIGVPLALVAFNAAWQPLFADRAAVVRAGGRPRGQALLAEAADPADPVQRRIAAGGDRFLWQARIEQLSEHLAEAQLAGAPIDALGDAAAPAAAGRAAAAGRDRRARQDQPLLCADAGHLCRAGAVGAAGPAARRRRRLGPDRPVGARPAERVRAGAAAGVRAGPAGRSNSPTPPARSAAPCAASSTRAPTGCAAARTCAARNMCCAWGWTAA